MFITKTPKGFAVVNYRDGLTYRTLESYQEAEEWRLESQERTGRK